VLAIPPHRHREGSRTPGPPKGLPRRLHIGDAQPEALLSKRRARPDPAEWAKWATPVSLAEALRTGAEVTAEDLLRRREQPRARLSATLVLVHVEALVSIMGPTATAGFLQVVADDLAEIEPKKPGPKKGGSRTVGPISAEYFLSLFDTAHGHSETKSERHAVTLVADSCIHVGKMREEERDAFVRQGQQIVADRRKQRKAAEAMLAALVQRCEADTEPN
jgi:hypothetical protein